MIRLAITMGDPAGIGPEIVARAFSGEFSTQGTLPLVIGHAGILERTAKALGIPVKIQTVGNIPENPPEQGIVPVWEPGDLPDASEIETGKISREAGLASRLFIDEAVRLIRSGDLDALCTGPIHKEAMHAAGFSFPGHTEYLAHLSGTSDFAMLMCGGGLRVALQTIHTALRNVPDMMTIDAILEKIRLLHRFIPFFGRENPRIGVCGLNPHAGEGGMFGREEIELIRPAIEQAASGGIRALGPFPADTIFHRMLEGDFDAILAMYHDQALVPIKTLAFYEGVNVTMGLRFIRTSVDHGTGFDIAGRGVANPASLEAAIGLAGILAENRRKQELS